MRVLFISSYNFNGSISPIVKNQADSLHNETCSISFFGIKGKGIKGYLKNVLTLREFLAENSFDVIHAHYSFSGIVASLAGAKPLVVSLMGSDIKSSYLGKLIIRSFNFLFWDIVIVKSNDSKQTLGIDDVHVVPNGVSFARFYPQDLTECKKKLEWNLNKKHILFAADPSRPEKNFALLHEASQFLNMDIYEIVFLKNIQNKDVPLYLNAADIVVLCSLWEGSPNVIKEALACNRPIVSSDCGDVKELISNIDGCYISPFDPKSFAESILLASTFHTISGRKQISFLDSNLVSKKLISIYNSISV